MSPAIDEYALHLRPFAQAVGNVVRELLVSAKRDPGGSSMASSERAVSEAGRKPGQNAPASHGRANTKQADGDGDEPMTHRPVTSRA